MAIVLKILVTTILLYFLPCEAIKCDGKTCAQCIGESVECVWCPAANHTGPRCQKNDALKSSWCSEKIQNPQPKNPIEIIRNDDFNATLGHEVQLTPQKLTISVRPGETKEFTLKYKPAKDYPLDVYFLMDYSYTMRATIALLKKQGETVYASLNDETNNVRIGIGSFIEKGALPYANPLKHYTYSFKHRLNFTTNSAIFKHALENIEEGENFDDPEAGLDALMQVMTCGEKIGWRKSARKIVVFATDSTYHSAGDGKIAGAAKLNDMQCHLENNLYTKELEQDYPSVNQIRQIAIRENIVIIFNVMKKVISEYQGLAKRLDAGAKVIELQKDSDISKIITDVYKQKLANVEMEVTKPDKVQVTLTPDCTVKEHMDCQLKHQEVKSIQVKITANVCLDKSTITIKPHGLNETLQINIETLCRCDCEDESLPKAEVCNRNGNFTCGICYCDDNRFGETCDCVGSSSQHSVQCKEEPKHTVVCTDRGTCRCGICQCHESHFSGKFCQYDDRTCLVGKVPCAGNGYCKEGRCECFTGWTGPMCECTLDEKECRAPYSDKICSGNGICKCGSCTVCTKDNSTDQLYFGPFCDNCDNCDEKRCKDLEKYVKCVHTNPEKKEACDEEFKIKQTNVLFVNKTAINAPEYHLAKRCTILLDDDKSIVFKHKYVGRMLQIIIQNELEEPDRANMWIAIGSSIGGILLTGLLALIIWKVVVDMHDAKEYERFNKMLDETGDLENINQIYQPATANFVNPLFKRQSRIN